MGPAPGEGTGPAHELPYGSFFIFLFFVAVEVFSRLVVIRLLIVDIFDLQAGNVTFRNLVATKHLEGLVRCPTLRNVGTSWKVACNLDDVGTLPDFTERDRGLG